MWQVASCGLLHNDTSFARKPLLDKPKLRVCDLALQNNETVSPSRSEPSRGVAENDGVVRAGWRRCCASRHHRHAIDPSNTGGATTVGNHLGCGECLRDAEAAGR